MKHDGMKRAAKATFALLAAASGPMLVAQDRAPARGERVALALATAQNAQGKQDRRELASALAVIDRSGAHPLAEWNGTDPVPQWRALVPDKAPPMRGSPLGPGYRSGQIMGGRSERFEQVFLSGQKASIALSTPGNAPISLHVLDPERKPVCVIRNTKRTCHWVPIFTQRYTIEVHNSGNGVADYFLVVD